MLTALLPLGAFAAHTLTSGDEQTIGGIKYKVLTVYNTETAAKVNTVSAQQNSFTGTAITIPATVTFNVQGTDEDSAPINKEATFKVVQIAKGGGEVGFTGLTGVTSLTIGTEINGVLTTYVKTIDAQAFDGCTSLETVTLGKYVPFNNDNANKTQVFGENIFKGTAVKELDLTKTTLATVESWFNKSNSTLETVKFPTTLVTIKSEAFKGCTALATVEFNKSNTTPVQTFNAAAFQGTAIATLDLTNTTITSIKNLFGTSFATPVKNTTLTTVTFPATVWTTDASAFANCAALKTVNFILGDKTLAALAGQSFGDKTFEGCVIEDLDLSNTTVTTIPSNLVRSDANANYNLKLKTVKMPKSLTTIKTKAFYNCTVLNSVDFKTNACTNLATIENFAFGTTPSLTALDFSACSAMVDFGDAVQPFVPAADGVNTELTSITLHTGTTNIGIAMKNLRVLSTLKAGTGTSLEKTAITKILTEAFTNDKALTSMSLPNTVATIAGTPFEGCTALASLTIDGTALTTLGTAETALFGATDDVLESLTISNNTAVDIKKGVLTNQSGLANVSIAAGKDFTGTIGDDAVAIVIADGGSLTLGNLGKGVNAATLNDGGIAVGDATNVTVGNIVNLTALTAEPIDGNVAKLVIGNITQDLSAAAKALVNGNIDELEVGALTNTKLDFFGQAAKITFKGAITAIVAPTTANAALEELDFGTLALTASVIVNGAFNPTTAPNLATVTWSPAVATTAFAANAFGDGTGRKVSLTTTTAVGEAYAWNLNNVEWDAAAKQVTIEVAQKDGQYWYGKHFNATENYKIAKEAEDGAKVIVYGAYVDQSDKAIYMEQLHIINGYYWIPANVPVIVKSTSAEAVVADKYLGGNTSMNLKDATHYVSEIAYLAAETAGTALMNTTDDNDWTVVAGNAAETVDNTDFDIYAMAKPEKHNIKWLSFKASTTLPAGTFYVRCLKDGGAPAPELNVIWTDGSEESTATGIENVNAKQQFDGEIFNLQGIRVSEPVKGQIYIQNGKKFMMK